MFQIGIGTCFKQQINHTRAVVRKVSGWVHRPEGPVGRRELPPLELESSWNGGFAEMGEAIGIQQVEDPLGRKRLLRREEIFGVGEGRLNRGRDYATGASPAPPIRS